MSDDLSSVMRHLDVALASVNEGKGSLGMLLYDNRFFEELVVATRRLTKTLDDLREFLAISQKDGLKMQW